MFFKKIKLISLKQLLSLSLQIFGALWLFLKIFEYFFKNHTWFSDINSIIEFWHFIAFGLLIALIRSWPRFIAKSRIYDTDVIVEVQVGDIFSIKGSPIIGSNTTFDTAMEDNTISKDSVQGQFTTKFCKTLPELDAQIEASLRNTAPVRIRNSQDKPYGKTIEYEFGTIAPIEIAGKKAYFVAIARLNEHKVASIDRNSFMDSLPRIWEDIRSRGGFEQLCCPILGSGFSRLNLRREELVREIIKSFIAATLEAKFCEKLTIAIHPNDFKNEHINFERIKNFIEHECNYARATTSGTAQGPVGTEL